jgi:CHAT domain-containing protein
MRAAAPALAAFLLAAALGARAQDCDAPALADGALARAIAARAAGDWSEAERQLESAAIEADGDAVTRLAIRLERANLAAARGEGPAARAQLAEVERDAAAAELPEMRARAAANRLRIEAEGAAGEGTRAALLREVEVSEALSDPALESEVLLHLGRSLALIGPATAPDAARAFARAEERAREGGDSRLRSWSLGYRAELYLQAGRIDESQTLARRAALAASQADAPEALYRWQWLLARGWQREGQEAKSLESYRDAARTLARLREDTAFSFAQASLAFETEVAPLLREYVDLALRRATAASSPEKHEALLREAIGALERLKAAELRDYFRDPCVESLARRAPDTIPGALVIYPIALDDRLELIASSAAGIEQHRVPVGRAELTAEVKRLRPLLQTRVTRQYVRPAEKLYDWLVRPIAARMAELRTDVLVFVPDGALRTIPFAALLDRESGQFLIEQRPVAVVPGMNLTEPRALPREKVASLVAGLTRSVQGYPALVGVEQELEALRAHFAATELLDEQFVEPSLSSQLGSRAFDIVHVASHGVFAGRVSDSFIVTFDGRLGLERLARLVGQTELRPRPLELLVLSACDTAVGDERAALGLAGVAVRAGARSALATLWPVNDRAAAQLIAEFYRQIAAPGVSRARALQRAQTDRIRSQEHGHPAFWSPFLLISNWL